jgi:hypothetical protein
MSALDDLLAAASRIEAAVTALVAALAGESAGPDLQPVTDGLNASAATAEAALAPTPAPPAPAAPATGDPGDTSASAGGVQTTVTGSPSTPGT